MLNCRAFIGVAICANNGVPHDVMGDRAEERIETLITEDPRAPELLLRPQVQLYSGSAAGRDGRLAEKPAKPLCCQRR